MSKDKDKDQRGPSAGERELIRDLAELLNETGLTEIEIERQGLKVRVARMISIAASAPAMHAASAAQPALTAAGASATGAPAPAAKDPTQHPGRVESPMVGTAYRAPEPGAPPFVEVGSVVKQGDTLLIIEAMKTMNHIPAPRSGTVRQILFDDAHPVEYGEPLLIIE